MKLGFAQREHAQWKVLAVTGDIDLATAPSLEEQLQALLATGATRIAVDLEDVDFMDSTGLRVLVGGLRAVPDGGFAVITTQANLLKIIELTSLDEVMQICASDDDLPE